MINRIKDMLEELCCVESEINRLLNEYEKEERIETKEKLKDDIIEEASTLIATRETLKKLIRSKCPDKIMSIEMDFSVNIKGLNRRVNKLLVRIADKLNFNYEWFIECLSVYSREKMF